MNPLIVQAHALGFLLEGLILIRAWLMLLLFGLNIGFSDFRQRYEDHAAVGHVPLALN